MVDISSTHLYTSPFLLGILETTLPSLLAIRQCHVINLGHRIMSNVSHFQAEEMRSLCMRCPSFSSLESANMQASGGHGGAPGSLSHCMEDGWL